MNKLLTTTAVALLLGIGPALAAEDYEAPDQSGATPEASQSDESLPSDPNAAPPAAVEDDMSGEPETSDE